MFVPRSTVKVLRNKKTGGFKFISRTSALVKVVKCKKGLITLKTHSVELLMIDVKTVYANRFCLEVLMKFFAVALETDTYTV